ncbi:MAG: hypothetical protein HFI03_14375 [Lachnospiraceae bacterium]|nr:hypothetical protein [Lachnospiraceae bacterium]
MKTIKNIIAESGEDCRVDLDIMHESLTKLPAEMYLNLYRKMHTNIYGYPPVVNWGGCCGTVEEKKSDIKIDVDYSEVDEARKKIDELGEKLDSVNELISKITGGRISIYASFAESGK